MEIVFVLSGIVIGAIAVWLIFHFYNKSRFPLDAEGIAQIQSRVQEMEINSKVADEKLTNSHVESKVLREELVAEREKSEKMNAMLAAKSQEVRGLQEKLETQKEEILSMHEKLQVQFKNLANEILDEKTKKFTDQNKVNLADILNPLKEKIVEFEKKVEDVNKENIARNSALKEQITGLRELNLQITKEAENLTKALKGESKTQGNWGEFILESILEKSGLLKNEQYEVQVSMSTNDGRRLQPDVVVKLPEQKNIIIDSKVSLSAYEKYVSAESEVDKVAELKNHLVSIRTHIKGLSEKNYQSIYQIGTLDFVLLFMPIEPAFSLAVQNDADLFTDAYERNIVIVSPTTLIATLRTIASIWRQENQNRNAQEIARQGGMLYDKFKSFADDLIKVGVNLKQTKTTYDEAMSKLSEGKDNLIRKTERLRELGAKTTKAMDQRLLERATDD
ncbi:MAG: DNA recombination protein RmuC [Cyclobacteriaceae bacterium]|nr:DNA recombination protein RmuC [Cyclobacteriaceae bacterium]